MNTIRTATTITTLGLVAMIMAGCASGTQHGIRPDGEDASVSELRLGYFANVTHAPALVGLEEGLFEDALGDVEVTTQVFNAGPAAIEALTAGAIDATYIGPNPSINTFIQSGGESAHIIAGAATGGAALVVADGIDTPDDLAGTTLAIAAARQHAGCRAARLARRRGLRDRHLGRRRRQHHADRERADAHALPAGRPRRRLAAGAVGLAAHRRRRRARARQDEADLWPDGEFPTTVLLVRAEFLEEHPDVVADLLEGHVASVAVDRRPPRRGAGCHQRARSRPRPASRSPTRSSRARSSTSRSRSTRTPTRSRRWFRTASRPARRRTARSTGLFDLRLLNGLLEDAGEEPVSADGLGEDTP